MSDKKKFSEKSDEEIRIEANSLLIHSKGFLLFTIDSKGEPQAIKYSGDLNLAERGGLLLHAEGVVEDSITHEKNIVTDQDDEF